MGGVTATAAVECAAGVIPVTNVVASVESALPSSIVGAATAAAGLPLLALVLLLDTLATSCLMSLIGLLFGIVACLKGAGCQVRCTAFGFAPAWH